jgi:hypothetical protein
MVDMQQTTLSTMKAIVVDAYGPPQNARFAEIDIPKLKDGYMLVRMRASEPASQSSAKAMRYSHTFRAARLRNTR